MPPCTAPLNTLLHNKHSIKCLCSWAYTHCMQVGTQKALLSNWLYTKLNLCMYQHPLQHLPSPPPPHLHSLHLTKAWKNFVTTIMAIMVTTSYSLCTFQKHHVTSNISFCRKDHSRHIVGQNQNSEWMRWYNNTLRSDKTDTIIHCLYGKFFKLRRIEWYLLENNAYGNDE